MSATQKDYYRILGVISSAELEVIKAVYKALMMIYHPDRYNGENRDAVRKTKEINQAYTVLSDPVKRKKYDFELLNYSGKKSDSLDNELNIVLNQLYKALNESEKLSEKYENELNKLLIEFRKTLKHSDEILERSQNNLDKVLNEFKQTLKESEAILNILNEPESD